MIDTHTHLYSDQFDEDRAEMIQRALDKGVGKFFLPAIDSETHQKMLLLKPNIQEQFFQ
jgi:TatD DNase family protein